MLEQGRAGVLQVVAFANRFCEVCRNGSLYGVPAFLRDGAPGLRLGIVRRQLKRLDQIVLQIGVGADGLASRGIQSQRIEQRRYLTVEFHAHQVRGAEGKPGCDRSGMDEALKIVAAFEAIAVFVEAPLEGFKADLAAQGEEFVRVCERRKLGVVAFERREPLRRGPARRRLRAKLAQRGLLDKAVPMSIARRRANIGQAVVQFGPVLRRRQRVEVLDGCAGLPRLRWPPLAAHRPRRIGKHLAGSRNRS